MAWCLIKNKDAFLWLGAYLSTGSSIYGVLLNQAQGCSLLCGA
jgi:hypothetical protein